MLDVLDFEADRSYRRSSNSLWSAGFLKLSPGWHTVRINIRYEKANQVNTTLEGSSVQLKPRVFLGAQKTRRLYGKIMRPGYHASWACRCCEWQSEKQV